jgi:hypothetical protein
VQIVAYTTTGPKGAYIGRLQLDSNYHGEVSAQQLARLKAGKYDVVAAIVTYDEPTEQLTAYARYTLKANGALQNGSRPLAK